MADPSDDIYMPYVRGIDLRRHIWVSDKVFAMGNLRWLRLNHNELAALDPRLYALTRLERLDLAYNAITEVSDDITRLSNLEVVHLHHNSLTDAGLRRAFFSLPLRRVDLSHNHFGRVPTALFSRPLEDLLTLNLAANGIETVPADLVDNCPNLRTLNLSRNNLVAAPLELHRLPLTELNLASNRLLFLDWSLCGLHDTLVSLDYSNNPMSDETIPRDLSQLTTLKELLLADVGLTKMPKAIYKLTSLTRLSLAGNSIGHLDGDLKDLSRLEGLNFSRNALDRFPVMLPSCVSLRRLYLNGNPLRRDSFQRSISNLSRLDLLSLSQCGFTECPREIFLLSSLRVLDLSANNLNTLPAEVYRLENVEALLVAGNLQTFVMPRREQDKLKLDADIDALREILTTRQKALRVEALENRLEGADSDDHSEDWAELDKALAETFIEGMIRLNETRAYKKGDDSLVADGGDAAGGSGVGEAGAGGADDGGDGGSGDGQLDLAAAVAAAAAATRREDGNGDGDDGVRGAVELEGLSWKDRIAKDPRMQVDVSEVFGFIPVEEGITVWRIDDFHPEELDEDAFGDFYASDSYLVLRMQKDEASRQITKRVFYWLGKDVSVDKRACAAIHAVHLQNYVGTPIPTERVLQGEETDDFLECFLYEVNFHEGGTASALEAVEKMVYNARLYHLKDRTMSPVLVELDLSVLNTDGCFVLEDGQDTLYLFFSPFTTLTQAAFGRLYAETLVKERHDTELTVVEVDMREGDHHDHVAHKRHLETFLKFFEEVSYSSSSSSSSSSSASSASGDGGKAVPVASGGSSPVPSDASSVVDNASSSAASDADDDGAAASDGAKGTAKAPTTAAEASGAGAGGDESSVCSAASSVVDDGSSSTGISSGDVPSQDEAWERQQEYESLVGRPRNKAMMFTNLPYLYEIDVASALELPQMDGKLSRAQLKTDRCYILDTGTELFVWLGRKTLKIQKQAALAFVQKYVEIFDRPYFTGMTRVLESAEPAIFRSKFADWNSAAPGIVDYGHSFKTARKAEMPTSAPLEFNVGDLYAPPRDLKVRRIRNTDDTRPVSQKCYFDGTRYVTLEDEDEYALFYSEECNVVICPGDDDNDDCIIYVWEGAALTDHKAWISYKFEFSKTVETLVREGFNQRVDLRRIKQGKEPIDFVLSVGGVMVIFDGKRGIPVDPTAPVLFQLQIKPSGETRAIEVSPRSASLNARDEYVLLTEDTVYVRHTAQEKKAIKNLVRKMTAKVLARIKDNRRVVTFDAGDEPRIFWEYLGGEVVLEPSLEARLLRCDLDGARFAITEVPDYTQTDLGRFDVYLLDTRQDLYVWVGDEASEEKRELSLAAAEAFIAGSNRVAKAHQVLSGEEPAEFTCWFYGWDGGAAERQAFVDPRVEREAKFRKMERIKARLVAIKKAKEAAHSARLLKDRVRAMVIGNIEADASEYTYSDDDGADDGADSASASA